MAAPRVITQKQIVDEARTWIGVPFRHIGRTRYGIDCVGLPVVIGMQLGLLPPSFTTGAYGRLPTGALAERIGQYAIQLPRAVPGSIVVIQWLKHAAHVAICTGPTLIHAYEERGKVIEHGYRGRWLAMTHSAWGFREVTYV